jgi:putative Holliday junction resolvase
MPFARRSPRAAERGLGVRILALDHGAARCGCAVSDPTGTLVTPLPVVERPDSETSRRRIAELASEYEAAIVLIGLPRLQSGQEGEQASAARAFAGRLAQMIDAEVVLFDERFTTRMAQASIAEGAVSPEDSLAAAHLLEEYLRTQASEEAGER